MRQSTHAIPKVMEPHVARWTSGLRHTLRAARVAHQIRVAIRGPQIMTFRVALADAADLAKVRGMAEQLALNMAVQSIRVTRTLDLVDVQVALPRDLHQVLPARAVKQKGSTWVGLGQTATGTPVHVNFAGTRTCHALISGTTGSGKTVTEWLIAWALAKGSSPEKARLILIDGKGGVHWRGFDREEHLAHPVIGDPQEAIAALAWAMAELGRRKESSRKDPTLFIVIDEIKELLDVAGTQVAEALRRIVALGRDLGMHAVVATQYPLAGSVGGGIAKANLPLRVTGRVLSPQEAYISTGVRNSGAEQLQGNGDFLVTVAGENHRVQIALVSTRDIRQLARRENTAHLDLAPYSLDRVLSVTETIPDADHVAAALIAKRPSIRVLKEALGIGQAKARRVRDYARDLSAALKARNHQVTPVPVPDHMPYGHNGNAHARPE